MTEPTNEPAGEHPLQFDAAEPTGGSEPLACTSCGAPIRGVYHEVNGAVACSGCRQAIERRLRGGSSLGRFARALALGAGAALLGAALYFGIAVFSGYEIGLIAIVVGWMVGRAVHAGSRGRGGWRYQTLAIALTYSAIVVTYMPAALERTMGIDLAAAADSLAADSVDAEPIADDPGAEPSVTDAEADVTAPALLAVSASGDSAALAAAADSAAVPIGLTIAVGTFVMFVLAWAEPFRQGPENLMGLVIIAIGLYQAWIQNKATATTITGPYTIGAARASGSP